MPPWLLKTLNIAGAGLVFVGACLEFAYFKWADSFVTHPWELKYSKVLCPCEYRKFRKQKKSNSGGTDSGSDDGKGVRAELVVRGGWICILVGAGLQLLITIF